MRFYACVEWIRDVPGLRRFSAVYCTEEELQKAVADVSLIRRFTKWGAAVRYASKRQEHYEISKGRTAFIL